MDDADRQGGFIGAPARLQQIARGVLSLALVLLGLWTIHGFIPALVWALIIAIALWPAYERARRHLTGKEDRVFLPAAFTLLVAVVFLGPLLFAAVQVGREAQDLLLWYQQVQATGIPPPDWLANVTIGNWHAADWWKDYFAHPPPLADLLRRVSQSAVIDVTRQLGSQLLHRTLLFFFTLLTLFFLFRDGERLGGALIRGSERMFGPPGERLGRQMIASVHGTVDGLVLVGLGEGLLLGIAYVLTGVPHPTLMGALTAIAAMIPFGAPVLFIIAALLLVAKGAVAGAIVVVVFGSVVIAIADHVIRPVVIGGATRLPFLWVLFGILGGVETWGLLGLFLGPAVMAALILLWRELTAVHEPATTAA